jgi:DNA-binding SARP family transcriptional activator
MLGQFTICRGEVKLELPASRKVRALLAYLLLSPHPVARSRLCELLWEVPNDPRGELRWCLSKIRRLVDEPERRRVVTQSDAVAIDAADCFVDALEISHATENLDALDTARLQMLESLFGGDLLDGLELEHSASFNGWLTAQRRRFRGCRLVLLERLVNRATDGEALRYLEKWLELAPFDPYVHERLLHALVQRDRLPEAESHLAAATQLFEAEGLQTGVLQSAWRSAKGSSNAGASTARRASVAVMPFADSSAITGARGGTADALAHDVITGLAKLRSLFVIAQGTVFALHERRLGPEEAGRTLNVDYVAGGSLRKEGDRFSVSVELTETRTARIIWSDVFEETQADAFAIIDRIANRIVASIANEIEASERNRAMLTPPNSVDAWQAHHRGLWHMYRFNKLDNMRAQESFEMAVRMDPTFSRAFAGLSFTHFQNAFQGWEGREAETQRAYEAAGQSLMADDRDPAAHWAMGRALWLRGSQDQSIVELQQAIDLSPNFALGHYTLAFVHSQGGDPKAAISSADYSRRLSPFDPLLFGMLGARAMALVRMGEFEEAAASAVQAAARPNAHVHIVAIAALCLALAGRTGEGRACAAAIHRTLPHYTIDDFLLAMRFDRDGEALFREGAKRIGLT